MPELPEVETTIRDLSPQITGRKIIDAWTDTPKLIKNLSFNEFKKLIKNKKILKLERRGKNILIFLSDNYLLLIHQKLTGHLLYGIWEKKNNSWQPKTNQDTLSDPYNRFIHLILLLDNKKMLALSDMRKFAKIVLGKTDKVIKTEGIDTLGIDPLSKDFTAQKLEEILKNQDRPIKTVLMDQNLISGIGNIYSDEILWLAKISPLRKAKDVKKEEIKTLYRAIKEVLKKALSLHGASIIDYRRPDGSKGKVDSVLKVYRKTGQKCSRCGGIIKRVVINGRSAHYCPKCQK